MDTERLFSGTASFYSRFRLPYPSTIFEEILSEYTPDGSGSLLDLGCGTGEVIVPLARYFGEAYGIDINSEMLEMARKRAEQSGITIIEWKQVSAERIDEVGTSFDLITAGNSFHWMDRETVLRTCHNRLADNGGMVILAGGSVWNGESEWQNKSVEVIQRYLGVERRAGGSTYKVEKRHEDFIAASPFKLIKKFDVTSEHERTVEDIIGYLFSTSFSKAEHFGSRVDEFQEELTRELIALNPKGVFTERMETTCFFLRK
ncbi:class I SAM-dependent methyltransferase [Bacillus sp. SCS-153A]|uniref:class I SAM-dependent methyltransferase n=1 Tax=Rossellomorea sedimentorum TaxID=3115294 RepID=UPI003906459C